MYNIDKELLLEFAHKDHVDYLSEWIKFDNKLWQRYIDIFKKINFNSSYNKNSKILDIGTMFGIAPWLLKNQGYKNIDSTEAVKLHDQNAWACLNDIWNYLKISPIELHIRRKQNIKTLTKKYDLILAVQSNIHWNVEEIVAFNGKEVFQEVNKINGWENFSVWNKEDWYFFINDIKKYLEPNGKIVFQISPFVYNHPDFGYYEDTYIFLKENCEIVDNGLLESYIIIR